MANSRTQRSRPVRTLVVFTILSIVLPFVALAAGVFLSGKSDDNPGGASFAPGLALDLQGGTQIILTPTSTDGSEITPEAIDESINVIRQRIDSSGVAEAEIAAQGNNVVVGIPGEASQETIDLVSQPAQMRFRPVLTYDLGVPAEQPAPEGTEAPAEGTDEEATDEPSGEPSEESSPDTSPNGSSRGEAVTAPQATATNDEAVTDEATQQPAEQSTQEPTSESSQEPATPAPAEATDPSDPAQITPEIQEQFTNLDCSQPENLVGGGGDDPDAPLVTCSQDGSLKWILGPVEIDGTDLTTASSGLRVTAQGVTTNEWAVNLDFDSRGTTAFRETTTRLSTLEPPRNQFAIVLDGLVVSAPSVSTPIPNGQAEISGSFTRDSAAVLANQLSFGSLPIAFEVQSQEQISATLGSEQLRNGLIAGLIGLALVVVYSLFQYRSLGMLTVASLVWAGLITYVSIALLSWLMGYRLSLAGVAGLIVAIGFTADSFIVYFERIRDEMRDGRSLASAVERGWRRARRTVLAAKSVNLISAVILYFLAVGGVQGFAFTLGLTTIIDVAVVFWFTHPAMQLLSKVPFFRDGHSWSGLSPERLRAGGVRYVGAGRVATQPAATTPEHAEPEMAFASATTSPVAAPRADASGHRMTIAERRAAERKAAAAAAETPPGEESTVDQTQHADRGENEESR